MQDTDLVVFTLSQSFNLVVFRCESVFQLVDALIFLVDAPTTVFAGPVARIWR